MRRLNHPYHKLYVPLKSTYTDTTTQHVSLFDASSGNLGGMYNMLRVTRETGMRPHVGCFDQKKEINK